MENQNKEPKQVIVIRTDLKNQKGEKVRSGKLIAQACHASTGVILDMMKRTSRQDRYANELRGWISYEVKGLQLEFGEGGYLDKWLNGLFTKVALQCDSEQELELLYYKAKDAGLPCKLIVDAGLTEFGGVPTKTCIAIGPGNPDKINEITGHLKLL
jgi:PTH2 family peptidyl-tRNA hydrolase